MQQKYILMHFVKQWCVLQEQVYILRQDKAAKAPPSILKVRPAVADVTLTVPVGTVHVGSTVVTVGAAGAAILFIVAVVAAETQPPAFSL